MTRPRILILAALVNLLGWGIVIAGILILRDSDLLWLAEPIAKLVFYVVAWLAIFWLGLRIWRWADAELRVSDWLDVDLPERERIAYTTSSEPRESGRSNTTGGRGAGCAPRSSLPSIGSLTEIGAATAGTARRPEPRR